MRISASPAAISRPITQAAAPDAEGDDAPVGHAVLALSLQQDPVIAERAGELGRGRDLGRRDCKVGRGVDRDRPHAVAALQKGIESGRDRILVGPDARALALLSPALPVRYFNVIKRLEPVVRR
jgi:hypothetical protein